MPPKTVPGNPQTGKLGTRSADTLPKNAEFLGGFPIEQIANREQKVYINSTDRPEAVP